LLNEVATSLTRPRRNLPKSKTPLNAQIIELSALKPHEEVDPIHLRELRKEIESDKILKLAIAVDKNTNIILDGVHRFNALKELGCTKIPIIYVDYGSPDIEVQAWRKNERVTKKDVIEAGLSGKRLPPKTSEHMIRICNTLKHISAIEKRVNISLEKLRGDTNDSG
jgi:ParB-like chromosome segregation protein Spo0J